MRQGEGSSECSAEGEAGCLARVEGDWPTGKVSAEIRGVLAMRAPRCGTCRTMNGCAGEMVVHGFRSMA